MSNPHIIFRKASLDRVSSPEQLNDYIKVFHPSIWLMVAAVAVLLIGAVIWGVYGRLTTVREAVTVVQNGEATCYVSPKEGCTLALGMEVRVGGSIGIITAIADVPMEIPADFDAYALYLGGFAAGEWKLPVDVAVAVPDGVYLAEILLETVSPLSFVLN